VDVTSKTEELSGSFVPTPVWALIRPDISVIKTNKKS
jgi:hypothetical protein